MRTGFIIFFTIVLVVWGLVNYYIIYRGWQTLADYPYIRKYYLVIFIFLAMAFFAGRILENYYLNTITEILICIGAIWMAFVLYFFLLILFIDLIRLSDSFLHFLPQKIFMIKKIYLFLAVFSIVSGIVLLGYINAANPVVNTININIPKQGGSFNKLNVLVASDIHLGTLIGKKQLHKLISESEKIKPDIILLAGDIIDEDIRPVIKYNVGEELLKLKAPLGVFGILGNHEYIGGVDDALKYLKEHDINILKDSCVLIENSFYLIGRDDRSITNFTGKRRKELNEIINDSYIDFKYPVLLLDHQPINLEDANKNNIDLQISGHTHHGQLWPFNYITKLVYQVSRGYAKINNTQFYVSSGFGTWGPKVRTGNRPEIVNILINFNTQ